jgi:hypothetical protein
MTSDPRHSQTTLCYTVLDYDTHGARDLLDQLSLLGDILNNVLPDIFNFIWLIGVFYWHLNI